MPAVVKAEIRVTRTPLGGSADPAIEASELFAHPAIKSVSTRRTQSVGLQDGSLTLRNEALAFTDYKSADGVKVEARRLGATDWTELFDGFIGDPAWTAGSDEENDLSVPILGWLAVLDIVNVDEELSWPEATAYTDIADDLIDSVLGVGYARAITADAAATTTEMIVPAGMSLRQALQMVRDGLNTGSNKWEHRVRVVAGVKTYELYKRSTSSQATIRKDMLLPGTTRRKGTVLDVVNRCQVIGAEVAADVKDGTEDAVNGTTLLDASTDRIAHRFIPLASPMASVTWKAARSMFADPPTVDGWLARGSDNIDILGDGALHLRTVLRSSGVTNPNNATDGLDTTDASSINGTGEKLVWDLGAGGPEVGGVKLLGTKPGSGGTGGTFQLQSSPDDSAWTTRATFTIAGGLNTYELQMASFTPLTARYWRLNWTAAPSAGGGSILEIDLLRFASKSTDATNPIHCQAQPNTGLWTMPANTTVATNPPGTSVVEKELARFDFLSARRLAKVVVQHQETSASALLVLLYQTSPDGSVWTTLATAPSSTGTSTDTLFLYEGSFRYFRVLVQDDRNSNPGSITTTAFYVQMVEATSTSYYGATIKPLIAEVVPGSQVSWGPNDLQESHGVLTPKKYQAPSVAVDINETYFYILAPTGGSATSWWNLDYTTIAAPFDDFLSTDSGATWSSSGFRVQFLMEFNVAPLISYGSTLGYAEDAASQTTYASFVPGGILFLSITDYSLRTQDAVDKHAATIVNRRKATQDTLRIVIPFDPVLVEGLPVVLNLAASAVLGYPTAAQTLDVVEVMHAFQASGATTTLICGEHFRDPSDDLNTAASQANERRS